jgi:hypothetical protein
MDEREAAPDGGLPARKTCRTSFEMAGTGFGYGGDDSPLAAVFEAAPKKLFLRSETSFDILPAACGEDSYGAGFAPVSSVGSSHNRLTSAEDNKEALLLGCPPLGPFGTRGR